MVVITASVHKIAITDHRIMAMFAQTIFKLECKAILGAYLYSMKVVVQCVCTHTVTVESLLLKIRSFEREWS